MAKNVKKADDRNRVITEVKIASVSPKRTFESTFHTDEAGNPKVIIGHYYGLRKVVDGVTLSMGEKFVSDKYMKEILNGDDKEFNPDTTPRNLDGSVVEFEGLVEVVKGEEFLPFEAEKAETAERDTLLFNKMTVKKGLGRAEKVGIFKEAIKESIMAKVKECSLDEIMNMEM